MSIDSIVLSQKNYFHSNATKDLAFRKQSLERLLAAITEHEADIYAALKKDLGKSETESYLTEVSMVTGAVKNAIHSLEKWSRPARKRTPLSLFPAKSYLVKEPYGVVLILSPWNYPFQLCMMPLTGAIAAGNCAVIKTSRSSANTSAVIADIIKEAFDSKYIYAVEQTATYDEILSSTYDYIFFTGSERVGRIVMRTASETLTPVSLELGGKSPCIIDKSANLELAAKRIVWGKLLNAGQTCVAPDYVVIPNELKDSFIDYVEKYIHQFAGNALENEDYPQIINLHHFVRLKNLIENEKSVIGGESNEKTFKIAPAVFPDATFSSDIMKAEIFGPILPFIGYSDLDDVIDTIKHRPKPLACYIFGQDNSFIEKITTEISFGGGCINDTVMHLANEDLPFGGVGSSGMGNYHGKHSFDTFSHEKSILLNHSRLDIPLRYPPYTEKKHRHLKWVLK